METSTSETPKQRLNPSRAEVFDQHEEVVLQTFRRLGLEDEYCESSSNVRISKKNQRLPEAAARGYSCSSGNSVSANISIWGYSYFFYGGDTSGTTDSPVSNYFKDTHTPNNKFNEIENRTPYLYPYPYPVNPYDLATNSGPNYGDSRWKAYLRQIQETLEGEQCPEKESLIYELMGFVCTLITNTNMHPIFQAFLNACEEGNHLDTLVRLIRSEKESFLNAAFCNQGVHSIVKLIKKLKKSRHAFTLTEILSTRFVELMSDHIANEVVHRCFILFRSEANEILYERAIVHCHYLATHKNGCKTLNKCISTISGEQRTRLLDAIAGIADILCDDYYGNYVLQNVMQLNHPFVNGKIIECLRGKFIQLSQSRIGSHCVEKCMGISEDCMVTVIEEILQSPRAPRVLAEDEYGNYVIQKALLKTRPSKEKPVHQVFTKLYNSLMNSLRPHLSAIGKTKYGKNVIDAIYSLKETPRDSLALRAGE